MAISHHIGVSHFALLHPVLSKGVDRQEKECAKEHLLQVKSEK
jgi:hypothetical protein